MKLGHALGWGLAAIVVCGGLGLQYASYYRQAEALQAANRALELAARAAADRPAPMAFGATHAQGPSAEEIRAIVREELRTMAPAPASAPPAQAAPTARDPKAAERAEPSPESMAAMADATRLIDRAIAAGRWDDSRVSELRQLEGSLTGDQMSEVGRKLTVAINQQKVRLAVTGSLF